MVKRIDSLNWQLFERRQIKDNNKTKRGGETDWMPIQAFFGTLKPALVKAKELNRARGIVSGDLNAAIAAIEKADADFIKQVDKVLKAVS
jgi:hypothetical protein